MRVTSGSHWADISEAPIGFRPRVRIMSAAMRGDVDGFSTALLCDRVTAWSYESDPKDPASWESVDWPFGEAVLAAAQGVWNRAPDPNDSSGKSSPLPQDDPSETPPTSS
jgi:hypothetical protein